MCVCVHICVSVFIYPLTYLPTYLSSYLLPSLLTYLVLQPFFSLEPSAKPQPRLGTWPSCCLADRLQGALPHGFFVWFIGKWRSYISYIPMFLMEIRGTKMINQPSFFLGNPAFRPKPLEWSENEEPKSVVHRGPCPCRLSLQPSHVLSRFSLERCQNSPLGIWLDHLQAPLPIPSPPFPRLLCLALHTVP